MPARSIGSWEVVLNVLVFAAITTNCADSFLVKNVLNLGDDKADWNAKIGAFFIAEHLCYGLKTFFAEMVPDVTTEVSKRIALERHFKLKVLSAHSERPREDKFGVYCKRDADLDDVPDFKFPEPKGTPVNSPRGNQEPPTISDSQHTGTVVVGIESASAVLEISQQEKITEGNV